MCSLKINCFKVLTLITMILLLFTQQSSSMETAIPAALLRPRNFNPHPYQQRHKIRLNGNLLQNLNYLTHGYQHQLLQVQQEKPPPNGIHSQGPVQFPTTITNIDGNAIDDVNNNAQQIKSQPYEQLLFKSRQQQQRQLQHRRLPQKNFDNDEQNAATKKHYAFSYTVRDAASGDDFSHTQQQQHDGAVKGSYKVQLPDGRTQVVKYTADNDGYKAEVSYIEGQVETSNNYAPIEEEKRIQQNQYSSLLASAEPIYNYHRNLQQQQQPVNYNDNTYVDNQYQYSVPSTPATYFASTPETNRAHYQVPLENVNIQTYNVGPHNPQYHQSPTIAPSTRSSFIGNHQILQHPIPTQATNLQYHPTASTPYNDIHVLPSPRAIAFSTVGPYLAQKSTSIIASPGSPEKSYDYYSNNNNNNYNHDTNNREAYLVAASVSPSDSTIENSILLRPNQALYFKTVQ